MTGVPWLRETGPDERTISKTDGCEAGTCGHPNCWQDDGTLLQRDIDRADGYQLAHPDAP